MSVTETTRPTIKNRRLRPVDRTFIRAFSSYTPPADLTVSQWAEQYRVLSRESSAEIACRNIARRLTGERVPLMKLPRR